MKTIKSLVAFFLILFTLTSSGCTDNVALAPTIINSNVIYVSGFESSSTGAYFNASIDSLRSFEKTHSLKLSIPNGSYGKVSFNFQKPIDVTNCAISYRTFFENDSKVNIKQINVQLYSLSSDGNKLVYSFPVSVTNSFNNYWNNHTIMLSNGIKEGVNLEDLKNITSIILSAEAVNKAILWVDDLKFIKQPTTPRVVLIFDDNNDDTYTTVWPYLKQKQMIFSVPTVSSSLISGIGQQGKSFLATQAKELQENGIELTNHTRNHYNMSIVNPTTAYFDSQVLQVTNDFIEANLDTTSLSHFVYPGGQESFQSYQYVKAHTKTARLVSGDLGAIQPIRGNDAHRLLPLYITNTKALSIVYKNLDNLKLYGGVCYVSFHRILPDDKIPSKPEDISFSRFKSIIEYIEKLGLKVTYMDEVWSYPVQKL